MARALDNRRSYGMESVEDDPFIVAASMQSVNATDGKKKKQDPSVNYGYLSQGKTCSLPCKSCSFLDNQFALLSLALISSPVNEPCTQFTSVQQLLSSSLYPRHRINSVCSACQEPHVPLFASAA